MNDSSDSYSRLIEAREELQCALYEYNAAMYTFSNSVNTNDTTDEERAEFTAKEKEKLRVSLAAFRAAKSEQIEEEDIRDGKIGKEMLNAIEQKAAGYIDYDWDLTRKAPLLAMATTN